MPTPLGLGSTSVFGGNPAAVSQPSSPDYINLLNQLNRSAQQASNVGRIPGESNLESQSSTNIGNELKGILPPDVLSLIRQQGAERGVAMGSPGSDNANAATLRALGLTSLGLQEQGQTDLTAATGRNPGGPLVNLTGQLLSPAEAGYQNINNPLNRLGLNLAATGPAPYTGPGSNQGAPALPFSGGGDSATPANWWEDITGAPSTLPPQYGDPNAQANPWSLDPSGGASPWGTDLTSSANSLDTLLGSPAMPDYGGLNQVPTATDLTSNQGWGTDLLSGDPFNFFGGGEG